jgi:hypothetical protein
MAKKRKYKDGDYYWVRMKIPGRQPQIAQFEDDSEGGRFRCFSGQWGTEYAYEILEGPLTYNGGGV